MIILKEKRWLLYTILAAICWAMWGTLTKYVSGDMSPYAYQLLFTTGMLFFLPFLIRNLKKKEVNLKGVIWGVSTSILAVIGNISVFQSFVLGGQASVVIPFTNLYPLVTIMVALAIFKEKLHWLNGIGILVVVPAIIMLSGQSQIFDATALYFQTISVKIWILYAFLSMVLFGLFNASQKITTKFIPAEWSYLSFIASSALVSICFIISGLVELEFSQQTFWVGSCAGMFDGLGVLAMYGAYRAKGRASQVSPIVATLQQLFTIGLAIAILGEKLSIDELIGIGLAIFGTWFLLFEKKKEGL